MLTYNSRSTFNNLCFKERKITMVYVYDILVNFNDMLYDFYDWKTTDDFYHVRRCPLFKVKTNILGDLTYKKVRIAEEFLSVVKDKTQVFTSKNVETLEYSFIVTDGINSLMVLVDKKGLVIKKSKFLINEEVEISNMSKTMRMTALAYNVINNNITKNKMLRDENSLVDKILEELEIIKLDEEKIANITSSVSSEVSSSWKKINTSILDYNLVSKFGLPKTRLEKFKISYSKYVIEEYKILNAKKINDKAKYVQLKTLSDDFCKSVSVLFPSDKFKKWKGWWEYSFERKMNMKGLQ